MAGEKKKELWIIIFYASVCPVTAVSFFLALRKCRVDHYYYTYAVFAPE